MRWKSREAEIERLRAKHGRKPYRVPLPDLKVERRGPPTSDRVVPTMGRRSAPPGAARYPVGHSHKQGLELLTPAMIANDLAHMGGRKT